MTFTVDVIHSGVRLDAYLAEVSGESRSAIVRAIDENRVEVVRGTKSEKPDKNATFLTESSNISEKPNPRF